MTDSIVFISYAHEDLDAAKRIYEDLKDAGFDPWLDMIDLLPGQRWATEIRKAIRNCSYFVALISSDSIEKRGFVQSEIKQAMDVLDEIPESEIFVIPVRLDDSRPSHERLRDIQWVDMFPDWNSGLQKILQAIGVDEEATGNTVTVDEEDPEPDVKQFTELKLQSTTVDFNLYYYSSTFTEQMLAVLTEWLDLDQIEQKTAYVLDFLHGQFTGKSLKIDSDTLPIGDIIARYGYAYNPIGYRMDGLVDLSDLRRRSRNNVRNVASLSNKRISLTLDDPVARIVIENNDSDQGNSCMISLRPESTFIPNESPVLFTAVMSYLFSDPPTDDLSESIRMATGQQPV